MIPQSPLAGPAGWLGSQQQSRSDWMYVLSPGEKAELDAAIRTHRAKAESLTSVVAAEYPLPQLGPAIRCWMRELDDGRGFILVRGFACEDYSDDGAAFAYWLIGLHMGRRVPQNRKGEVLGHVRDDGADPTEFGIRPYGTRVKLDFHTDGADIIGLMCLAQGKEWRCQPDRELGLGVQRIHGEAPRLGSGFV